MIELSAGALWDKRDEKCIFALHVHELEHVFKIIDRYILKSYLPLLLMSTLICWFIILMQFLWRYVDELIGKGLGVWIVAKIVFYAAMTFLPMALPLGILLGSLIFFGNLGEKLELLAMKSSGISLLRIMRSQILAIVCVAVGLFYFQNTFMITSQVRMWTLLLSARYSAPEVEIPEGVFYNGLPDYSIFVSKRSKDHPGRMHDIMIYDYKRGTEHVRIVRADSGRIVMNEDKLFLTWRLYQGQSFENLRQPDGYLDPKPIPYAKERFAYKEIVVPFDANFQQMSEEEMKNLYVGRNLSQLNAAIDTARMEIDSIRSTQSLDLRTQAVAHRYSYNMPSLKDTTAWAEARRLELLGTEPISNVIDADSLLRSMSLEDSLRTIGGAATHLQILYADIQNRHYEDATAYKKLRTNNQEWHRKFTFPFACLVFFFIGAPLGAIIRRGGIGVPVIVSIVFFLIYYIIDTFCQNMISSEKMEVWIGMWISTLVLVPVGVFLTISATRDSSSLNVDAYALFFRRLLGRDRVRKVEYREVVFEGVDYSQELMNIDACQASIDRLLTSEPLARFTAYYAQRSALSAQLSSVSQELENLVQSLNNARSHLLIASLTDLPILPQSVPLLMRRSTLRTDLSKCRVLLSVIYDLLEKEQKQEANN